MCIRNHARAASVLLLIAVLSQTGCSSETDPLMECETDDQCGDNGFCHAELFVCFDAKETQVPTFTAMEPASPSRQTQVTLVGKAEPRAIVSIFNEPTCATKPLLRETVSDSGDFRVTLTVNPNSSTSFYGSSTRRGGFVSACSSALVFVNETISPTAALTTPAPDAQGVAVSTPISVTFSEPISPDSLNAATFKVSSAGGAVEGTLSIEGAVVTFKPSRSLRHLTAHTVEVSAGVLDMAGNPVVPARFGFVTAPTRWSEPLTVSRPSEGVIRGPVLKLDSTGTAMLLWLSDNSLVTAARCAAGAGPELTPLTDSGDANWPDLVTDGNGNATAGWIRNGAVETRHYSPAGGWAPAQTLYDVSAHRATELELGGNAEGDALAMWLVRADDVATASARYRPRASNEWMPQELVKELPDDWIEFTLAVEPSGRGLVVLNADDGTHPRSLFSIQRTSSGWQEGQPLTSINHDDIPAMALNASGWGGLVWYGWPGPVKTRTFTSANGWAPEVLQADSNHARGVDLGVGPSEHMAIAWAIQDESTGIWARIYDASSGWLESKELIHSETLWNRDPAVATDKNGNAVVLWAAESDTQSFIYYSRYIAGQGWEQSQPLVEAVEPFTDFEVAMNEAGEAIAVWAHPRGAGSDVRMSRLPLP
jgi:hypothetical protein